MVCDSPPETRATVVDARADRSNEELHGSELHIEGGDVAAAGRVALLETEDAQVSGERGARGRVLLGAAPTRRALRRSEADARFVR